MKKLLAFFALAALAVQAFAADVNYGNPKVSVTLGTNPPSYGLILKSDGNMNYWGSGDGLPGSPGPQGPAGTIRVNSTSNGAPGSAASVTNVGTLTNALLNFLIPVGSNGTDGATGPTGAAATIAVGWVSNAPYGSSAVVTNTGNSNAAVFSFVIPAGSNGAPGATGAPGTPGAPGAPGAAATVAVGWVSNAPPGSTASVTNSGTSNNAVLNFVLVVGSNGPAGPAMTNWAEYAATTNVDMNEHGLTNVTYIELGGEYRTNWPTGGGSTSDVSTWASYPAGTNVNFNGFNGTNVGSLHVTNAITLGGVSRTTWPVSGAALYRYSALATSGEEIEVLATDTGITASWSTDIVTFSIPAGVKIISARLRIAQGSTHHTAGVSTFDMGTTDMGNSSAADRWIPNVTGVREVAGSAVSLTVSLSGVLTTYNRFKIAGISTTPGETTIVKLSF